MSISFSCPRCGTHFKVSDSSAGKKGRCKKCSHQLRIPAHQKVVTQVEASGMFRMGSLPGGGDKLDLSIKPKRRKREPGERRAPVAGRKIMEENASRKPMKSLMFPSNVGLAPISNQRQKQLDMDRVIREKDEDLTSGSHYKLNPAPPVRTSEPKKEKSAPAPGAVQEFYWKYIRVLLGMIQSLGDFAYLVMIPFIPLIAFGITMKNRDVAVIGATGIVLCNLWRFITNGIALCVMPFKSSLKEGLLFFIPPFTFIYLAKHWKRMKRATYKFLSPAIPIFIVVMIFVLVPWLRGSDVSENATISAKIKEETKALGRDMKKQVEKGEKKLNQAVNKTEEEVDKNINSIKGIEKKSGSQEDSPESDKTPREETSNSN